MRDFCKSLFWSTVLLYFCFSFFCVWLDYTLKKDFAVHTKGVVLISGTSSGIGKHATFTLAEYGYKVFATVRNEKSVQSLKQEAETKGLENQILPIIMDVTNSTQIESGLIEITAYLSKTGLPMVAIVNNAGFSGSVPIELEYSEHVQKMFDVNFVGSVCLTQKFLPLIRGYKGRIIFIGSLGGFVSTPGRSTYGATKRAIEAVVDTLRLELQPFGVSVSSLVAAYVKTSIVENSISNLEFQAGRRTEDYMEYFKKERESLNFLMKSAPSPEVTSDAIVDSILNPFPFTRYFMGSYGKFSSYFIFMYRSFVPDRFADIGYMKK